MHDLGGAEAFEFREERGFGFRTSVVRKIAGGQIHEREAERFPLADDGGEEVIPAPATSISSSKCVPGKGFAA